MTLNTKRNPPERDAWKDMKRRCLDSNDKDWMRYGGRGILVWPEWVTSYASFLSSVGEKPEPKKAYSLGRIDNDGPYWPGNVEWQLRVTQMNNKSNSRVLVVGGVAMTGAEVCRQFSIPKQTLYERLDKKGMTPDQAVAVGGRQVALRRRRRATHKLQPEQINGIRQLLAAGCNSKFIGEIVGVSGCAVRSIKHGRSWSNV